MTKKMVPLEMIFGGPGYVTTRTKRGFTVMPITATAWCADCIRGRKIHRDFSGNIGRTISLAGAAQGFRENVNFHGLLAAVGLRHAGDADERILFDIRKRRLDDAADRDVVRQFYLVRSRSRDLTVSIGPSTPSMVPRTRTVGGCCWAKVADVTIRAKPAAPKDRRVIWSILILPYSRRSYRLVTIFARFKHSRAKCRHHFELSPLSQPLLRTSRQFFVVWVNC